jgi:hypothetical protein
MEETKTRVVVNVIRILTIIGRCLTRTPDLKVDISKDVRTMLSESGMM